jgi:hypothetical protein
MARPKNLDFGKRPFGDVAERLGGLGKTHGVAAVSFRLDAEALQGLKTAQKLLSKTLERHVIASTVMREALKYFAAHVQEKAQQWEEQQKAAS